MRIEADMEKLQKNTRNIIIGLSISVAIVIFILLMNYFHKGKNLFFESLTQGEVITGIIISVPAFITWSGSISDRNKQEEEKIQNDRKSIENEKRRIVHQALEIVKHYDEQLYDLTTSISENGLDARKATKIVYITETFNKLFKEINAEKETKIYLDFSQILMAVCSTKYPDNLLDNPMDLDVREWKESVATCLVPALKEIIHKKEEFLLEKPSVRYFSMINFGNDGLIISDITFKNKSFIECTFTKEFIESNAFENCEFIDCSFDYMGEDNEG